MLHPSTAERLVPENIALIQKGLRRRHRRDVVFRSLAHVAVMFALGVLVMLVVVLGVRGIGGFTTYSVPLTITFPALDPADPDDPDYDPIEDYDYPAVLIDATIDAIGAGVVAERSRETNKALIQLLGAFAADDLAILTNNDRTVFGTQQTYPIKLSDIAEQFLKGNESPKLSDQQRAWLTALQQNGLIDEAFNRSLFLDADSREAEYAGLFGAIIGSMWMMLITIMLALPLGVLSAVYLEEIAAKNAFTTFLELTVNNLAAVPSIVFGLLGLSILIQTLDFPRSAPVTGGVVLAMMTLPVIVVATRTALASVPASYREGAFALGATRLQAVFNHVLPYATPGIMTGTIIGVARALGESAPLIMIGMVAFVAGPAFSATQPSTALPAQVFIWSDLPEQAFAERTASAILVLLLFMIATNLTAIILRNHYDKRNS
ncbi:MAG: phosphate ABC transporter permease PstA [Alphaproteobacteria bacterium]|nr:phosphate ABC transporter permease PstA [Alphaproteobacteria bacterium]